ncbi:MAG TPA: DUF5990 family protein [Longimicrobiaceae bacterium]|nr:DUF5990 family protein [Longimicrobiaceae bacterium]
MTARPAEREVPLRITLEAPPAGVPFVVQLGKTARLPPTSRTADAITFDTSVRVVVRDDGSLNFLGPAAQGTPQDRFVYVGSGKHAGDPASPWDRRAKVKLAGIDAAMVEQVLAKPGRTLHATIPGTMRDGSPVCASVALLHGGWKVDG